MSTVQARVCRHQSNVAMRFLSRSPEILPGRMAKPATRTPMGQVRHIPPMHIGLANFRPKQ